MSEQIKNNIIITRTHADDVHQLEELQHIVFPDLADDERFKAEHYLKHIELFPEGQFVALSGDRVVGMTTTIRQSFDFEDPSHRFADVIDGGYLTSHDPNGEWLYGMDIGTHPEFRRMGIGKALYAERHRLVRRLGLSGQVTVGMLNGYHKHEDRLSVQEYFVEVAAGKIVDPTVTLQKNLGFDIEALIQDYLDDPTCGNAGALIIWPADRDFE